MYTYQNWYLNKIESNLVDFGSIWQAKIQSEATVFFTYESLLEGIESIIKYLIRSKCFRISDRNV